MQIELKTEMGELSQALTALRERMSHKQPVMAAIGEYLQRQTRMNFEQGGRPKKWEKSIRAWAAGRYGGKKEAKTLMGSGRLAMSIEFMVSEDETIVGTNVRYAAIHQMGGIIRPTKAKALTVPLSNIAKGKRAREFQDLFVFKSKTGAPLLVRSRAGKLEPLYALVQRVYIPKRPFLVWLPEFEQDILAKLSNWALKGAVRASD